MKRARIFGSLPDKAEDALRKKYGSRDYNALDAEMRKTLVKVINQDLTPCLSKISGPRCFCGATRIRKRPCGWGRRWRRLSPTRR